MLKKVEVKCNNHIMENILDYFIVAQNQRKAMGFNPKKRRQNMC